MRWQRLALTVTIAGIALGWNETAYAVGRIVDQHGIRAHHYAAKTMGYYVDFLARPTQYFGHSYVQIGTIDHKGRSHPAATAGFYPKSVKSVFGAPGFVTATSADLGSKHSVRYRLAVSRRTFKKTSALIGQLTHTWDRYDLVGHNCNHLIGSVAGHIGLAVPGEYADLPENYVRAMASSNGGRIRASWR